MSRSLPSHVSVVGVGADGWDGLAPAARERICAAGTVIGAPRQLGLLPPVEGQDRCSWPSPFSLAPVHEHPDRVVVVLASGDPLVSGVAAGLRSIVGDRMDVVPAVSSVALARARMLWSGEETVVVSAVGRRPERMLRELAPGRRILLLSADEGTPTIATRLLVEAGYGASPVTVLGDLGGPEETRTDGIAHSWDSEVSRLNVMAIEAVGSWDAGSWAAGSLATGLPDEAFEHDGQLTKRDLRASALARLAPQPGQRLWDVGAGAGSVGIEWMRADRSCRTDAVERDPARVASIERNAARLGVPDLAVHAGDMLEVLPALDRPHAVFVGGGASLPGVLDVCRDRLLPGGRLVVHGVTLETETLLARAYAEHGGELSRIAVESAAPVGSFSGFRPARAVTQWSWGTS